MLQVRADEQTEAGVLPKRELVAAMGKFNEEMMKAGVLLSGDGLHPSSKGARVTFSGPKPTVTEGPFAEPRELIAGFWMIEVKSKAEAIDWARRVPFAEGVIEIRQVFEASDFPPEILSTEDAAREDAMRDERRKKSGRSDG
jgi:hypothetical protein